MYTKLLKKIEDYDKIIIHRHFKPDGDALGSQLGIKQLILDNYPTKKVYAVGDVSSKYSFIGEMDLVNEECYDNSLVIVVDCADEKLISDQNYKLGNEIVKIDHHISRNDFGSINIVDNGFESCAGLIADFAIINNLIISSQTATFLFTGMVTDSGRFRYSSTNEKTFNNAAFLLKYGANMQNIYRNLYVDDLKIIRLKAMLTLKFKITNNNVAYMFNNKEEIRNYGVDFFTISRGMVNIMSGISGVNIWVNFTEDEENDCVIAEIRSNSININQIALKYGGGGHLNASGATLKNFDEALMMLEDLDKLSEENDGHKD